jgi:excisionase family DNA binding protein
VSEAAKLCGVSQRLLYKEITAGKVRTVRIGTKRIVSADEIARLMASRARSEAS